MRGFKTANFAAAGTPESHRPPSEASRRGHVGNGDLENWMHNGTMNLRAPGASPPALSARATLQRINQAFRSHESDGGPSHQAAAATDERPTNTRNALKCSGDEEGDGDLVNCTLTRRDHWQRASHRPGRNFQHPFDGQAGALQDVR